MILKKLPTLRGKSVVTLFYEPSTRTRTSFELAGKYLSADVVNITSSTSSIVKGESFVIHCSHLKIWALMLSSCVIVPKVQLNMQLKL